MGNALSAAFLFHQIEGQCTATLCPLSFFASGYTFEKITTMSLLEPDAILYTLSPHGISRDGLSPFL